MLVTFYYPHDPDASFDFDHFTDDHVELVREALGDSIGDIEIERGEGGLDPDDPPPYTAIWRMEVRDHEAFLERFDEHADELLEDAARVTDIDAQVQTGEVVLEDPA